jgi:homocysteine S-methyltransferase
MKNESFLEILSKRVLIADGAMGTMLYQKGVFINSCFDELCLTNEDLIGNLHKEYFRAGADFVETNTFGANEIKLGRFGLSEKTELINKKAVEIAKKAVDGGCFVGGAMGPLGVEITEQNRISKSNAKDVFKRQAKALIDSGVDFIILETFANQLELMIAISAVSEIKDIPIVAQMTILEPDETYYGAKIQKAIREIQAIDAVSAVGLNCSMGPSQMLSALDMIKDLTDKPISIQPNAGLPQEVDGRSIYMCTPEYMAEYAKRFFEKGARIIGGCCGTTPGHIREISKVVKSLDRAFTRKLQSHHIEVIDSKESKGAEPVAFEKKSRLSAKLASGQKVVSIEMSPPKGINLTGLLEKVKKCADYGVDAINIPDGPRASSRLSALATAIRIQQIADIEVILHVCCRDKNLIAMQSDMLGVQAVGLKNVLMITGDPPKLGEYPNATAVYDLDSVSLTKVVYNLNRGLDIAGNSFDPPLALVAGVGVNPVAIDIDREIERFKNKVDSGAEYAITQPVFDAEMFLNFLDRIKDFKIPILAGIWPLTSYKNAEFMANEVPGVFLPGNILERMRKTQSREQGIEEGIIIAREMADHVEKHVAGFAVSAPFGNVNIPLAVLGKIGLSEVF